MLCKPEATLRCTALKVMEMGRPHTCKIEIITHKVLIIVVFAIKCDALPVLAGVQVFHPKSPVESHEPCKNLWAYACALPELAFKLLRAEKSGPRHLIYGGYWVSEHPLTNFVNRVGILPCPAYKRFDEAVGNPHDFRIVGGMEECLVHVVDILRENAVGFDVAVIDQVARHSREAEQPARLEQDLHHHEIAMYEAVGDRKRLPDQRHRVVGGAAAAMREVHPLPVVRVKGKAMLGPWRIRLERWRVVTLKLQVYNAVTTDECPQRRMWKKVFQDHGLSSVL